MDTFKRTIVILTLMISTITYSQWFDFLGKKNQGYYTYSVGATVGVIGEYAIINVVYTKLKTSYVASKKVTDTYVWLNSYLTNFSTMDTTLSTDSVKTFSRYLFFANYKYGSEIFYRGVIKTEKDSIYTHAQNNFKFYDLGCLYDINKYPLVDVNNQIIYPGD